MKKTLITLAIVLLSVTAQAQTAFKVHNDGQISLQSATSSYGIQIPPSGVASFEPNILLAYGRTSATKARSLLAKAWVVYNEFAVNLTGSVFYVLGNGNVYSNGQYTLEPENPGGGRDNYPIENASSLVSRMKGYYLDNHEFDDIHPRRFRKQRERPTRSLRRLVERPREGENRWYERGGVGRGAS